MTKIKKLSDGGVNFSWQCNFCHVINKSSYTRVRAHLLKIVGQGIGPCLKVTPNDIADMQRLEDEAKTQMERKAPKNVPLSMTSSSTSIGGVDRTNSNRFEIENKKRKGNTSALEKSFNKTSRDQLDALIAQMFYSTGLPFHLARNPHFIGAFTYAANNPLPGYKPPRYNMLRTSLLQMEKANIERLLMPIKGE